MTAMYFFTLWVLLAGMCAVPYAVGETVKQAVVLSHHNGPQQVTLTSPYPEETILATLDVFYVPDAACGAYSPATVAGAIDGRDDVTYSATVPPPGKPGVLWDVGLNTTGVVALTVTTSATCIKVRFVAEFIEFDGPLEETHHRVKGALGLMRVPLTPDRFVTQVSMELLQLQGCQGAMQRVTNVRVPGHTETTTWNALVGVRRVLYLGMMGFTEEDVVVSVEAQGQGAAYDVVSANGTTRIVPNGVLGTCQGEVQFTVASYPVILPVRTPAPTWVPRSDSDSSNTGIIVIVLISFSVVVLAAGAVCHVCRRTKAPAASFREAEMGPTDAPMRGV